MILRSWLISVSNNDITTSRGLQVFNSLRIRGRAWRAPPGTPPKSAFNGADPNCIEAVPNRIEAVPKRFDAVPKCIRVMEGGTPIVETGAPANQENEDPPRTACI